MAVVTSVLVAFCIGCGGADSSGAGPASPGTSSGELPADVTVAGTAPALTSPTTSTSTTTSAMVPTSLSYPDQINDRLEVEDGHYATVEEMAQAADLVIVGGVVGVESLGRPSLDEDEWSDEYVAIKVDVAEVLKGVGAARVVLAWDAIQVDSDGARVATLLGNGIRPPEVGDVMLLFLDPAVASFVEAHGGVPTHSPVLLDGVVYLDDDRLVAGEIGSTTAAQLLTMSLPQIRALVEEAAGRPRDVGEPIRAGGL